MQQTIQTIQEAIAHINCPDGQGRLLERNAIQSIKFEEDKLVLHFNFPRSRDAQFTAFQKELLTILKINLGIEKVSLHYIEVEIPVASPSLGIEGSRYLAIISGKGGVGKSTVTVHLAEALRDLGKKVAIIDADIYGSSIPQILKMCKQSPMISGQKVLPFMVNDIQVISSSLLIPENKPVMWKGPMLSKMLKQFFTDVDWATDTDYFLIDMPPGTGDIMIELQQNIPSCEMLVVTTPQDDAAYVATKAGLAALDLDHDILGVIENMSYVPCTHCHEKTYVFGKGGGAYVAEALGSELLAEIPLTQEPTQSYYHHLIETIDKK